MTYASLFSGAEGAGKGLEAAGFRCLWQCEINPQASDVLRYRYPGIVNYGNVTKLDADHVPVPDVLWMSPPCQDLSVAGARKGLEGERSGLFYDAVRIAGRLAERGTQFVCMEQVPGLFSSNDGEDFRSVLQSFLDIGARDICWTVLDGQWFGVPQRRKRAFFVVDFAGERAEEILFEPDSLRGNPPPSREAGQDFASVAGTLSANRGSSRNANELDFLIPVVSHTLSVVTRYDFETETFICDHEDVRRFTPLESERLMGWGDDWTRFGMTKDGRVYEMSDAARYKMCGNGVISTCSEWIGRRVMEHLAEDIDGSRAA